MGKIFTGASMSLDGYISGPNDSGFDLLFRWYNNGDVVATARRHAGDKNVGVNGGTIASQCLDAGLLDEVWVDLVPVILGGGTRFFDRLRNAPVVLDSVSVIEGTDVTHHRFRIRKG